MANRQKSSRVTLLCERFCLRYIFIIIACLFPLSLSAQVKEEKLKSLILGKIVQYISWPKKTDVQDSAQPLILGVLGKDNFSSYLQKVYGVEGKKIIKKKVTIRLIERLEDIDTCHILYIAKSEVKQLDRVLKLIQGKPILLVGDTKGFGVKGVHINFFVARKKVRFELNESAAKHEGLEVDFRLRTIAKVVGKRLRGGK